MRRRVVPGGIAIGLIAAIFVVSCGLDVNGVDTAVEPEAGVPPIDASRDVTGPPHDANGSGDTGNRDGNLPPPVDAATDSTPPPVDSGVDVGVDSGIDSGVDSGIDSGIDAGIDSGVDAGCTPATGCFVLPSGWSIVAYTPSPSVPCPTDYQNPMNVVEKPLGANAGACTCDACNVSTEPSCTTGQVGVHYDMDNSKSCLLPTTNLANNGNNESCNTDNFHGAISNQYDVAFSPPGPQGGACTPSPATQHDDQITSGHDTICSATSPSAVGCNASGFCTLNPGAPFQGCITHGGQQACPPGLGLNTQHLIGSAPTFTCSACGCNLNASCGNQTVEYYTDGACATNPGLVMKADGSCNNQGANGGTYGSYKFFASSTSTCGATGTSTASMLDVANLHTVCCPP